MGVPAGTHGIGQQHPVKPRVDDAVARAQRHPTAVAHEGRQITMGFDIDRFRVRRGMAERLHHQVR